jgi:hypothetical protein
MTTIGVLGGAWRGAVGPDGSVVTSDGSATLSWAVVAEDRWHHPGDGTSAVRQRRLLGAPVIETSVRVPGGDAVERVYAVADHGGLTVIEVENRSNRSFAVVFSRDDLLASRPAVPAALAGTGAPAGSMSLPVGHGTTVRVALAHDGRIGGPLPGPLSSAEQVARGWRAQVDRGPRLILPDEVLSERLVGARSAVLLDGPGEPGDDPVGFLLAAQTWVRLGQHGDDLLDDVVVVAERLARRHRRDPLLTWDVDAALAAAADVARSVGDDRAGGDAEAVRRRLAPGAPPPPADRLDGLSGSRLIAAVVAGLARQTDEGLDALAGLPASWFGQSLDAYGIPVGAGTIGLAVRWHGARPALLWESTVGATLRTSRLDPSWSSSAASGEALLGIPPGELDRA